MTSTYLHHVQIIALILCFLLIAGSGLILIVGTANAQENTTESDTEDTNNNDEEQTSEQNNDTDDEQAYEYIFPGDNLRIVDSHWEGKTLVATFEAVNIPERITVTDGGRTADNNENVELDRQRYTIGTSGTTEVRFSVVEDRQVTIDDGRTLLLKGYSNDISAPDVHTVVSAVIGLMMAYLLIIENARRAGKLSKDRVVKA